jgi:hypothetical protein
MGSSHPNKLSLQEILFLPTTFLVTGRWQNYLTILGSFASDL